MNSGSNTGLAVVASLLPLAISFAAGVLLVGLVGPNQLAQLIQGGGFMSYAVFAATLFASFALLPLVILMGRGRRIPAVIPLVIATLPWWVGLAGVQVTIGNVASAIAMVNPADKLIIAMAGFGETLGIRVFATWYASALLSGLALAFGLCAVAAAPIKRTPLALLVALPVLPILGIAAIAAVSGSPKALLFIGLPAAAFLVAAALAGLFGGVDAQGRSGAGLSIAAIVAGTLGVAAGAAALGALEAARMLNAVASVNPADRLTLLGAGLSAVSAADQAAFRSLLLGGASLVMMLGFAFRPGRPSGAVLGGAIAAIVFGAVLLSADGFSIPTATSALTAGSSPGPTMTAANVPVVPWPSGEFSPIGDVTLGADEVTVDGDALGLAALDEGTPERATFTEKLKRKIFRDTLEVAADATVDARLVERLARVAHEAGADTLAFAARSSKDAMGSTEEVPKDYRPLFDAMSAGVASVSVHTVVEGAAMSARVTPDGDVEVRDASGQVAFMLSELVSGTGPITLSVGEGVSLERYLTVASKLQSEGYRPTVAPAAADPQQQPAHDTNEHPGKEHGLIGLGGTAAATGDAPSSLTVMGSLDKEVIRRVVKGNLGQVKACYERELARSPRLAGNVTVKFVIAASGEVATSKVASDSTQNDAFSGCVAAKVKTWRFPAPKGGGVVVVQYPFSFKPAAK